MGFNRAIYGCPEGDPLPGLGRGSAAAVRGLRATFEELVTGSGAVGLDAITAGKFIRYVRVGPVVQVIILMG